MIFLGTGASELVPSPFCDCKLCSTARERKGIYLKKRSCFMLNEKVLFDFGPDLPVACQYHDVNLTKLEHIFITHTHDDHLLLSNIWLLLASRKKFERPIDMHMSYEAFIYCKPTIERLGIENHYQIIYSDRGCRITLGNGNRVEVKVIDPYAPVAIGGMDILAIHSNHTTSAKDEKALNYVVTTEDGMKLLYACDTGLYSQANLEALTNTGLNVLIMEATFGSRPIPEGSSHLNGEHFIQNIEKMAEYGIVNERTNIFSTHLSQAHDANHDDLQSYFDNNCRFKITVAYDGLIIA